MKKRLLPVFFAGIFLSLHYATVVYVNSSFLGKYFSPIIVSSFFILGATLSIYSFIKAPRILGFLGGKRFFLVLLLIETLASLGLATTKSALEAGLWFLLFSISLPLLYYVLDIFLEEISQNAQTGEIRGIYLTLVNAAIASGPLIIAALILGDNLEKVYFASLFLLLPIFIFVMFLKTSHHEKTWASRIKIPFAEWRKSMSIRRVTLARTILNFFYAIMTIFIPPYLRYTIGFEWSEIGIMFTIMLLPFILFEWPVGELADRYFGEKEFMTAGFFITGVAVLFMPFLGTSFLYWTIVLFVSRIGASVIEITTETYFFKKINGQDDGLISIFRLTNPVGIILGSLVGMVVSFFAPFSVVLFVLALAVLFGMRESALIKDTL